MNILKALLVMAAILIAGRCFAADAPAAPTKEQLELAAGKAAAVAKADELTATEARDAEATRRRGLTFLQARKEDGARVVEAASWADGQMIGVIGTPFTWTSGRLVALADHVEPAADRAARERLQQERDNNRTRYGLPTEAEQAEQAEAAKAKASE